MTLPAEVSPLLGFQFVGRADSNVAHKAKRIHEPQPERCNKIVGTLLLTIVCLLLLRLSQNQVNNEDSVRRRHANSLEKNVDGLTQELFTELRTTVAKSSVKKPAYTKVQTLSFQIYTGGAPAYLHGEDDDSIAKQNDECINLNSYGLPEDAGISRLQCYLGLEDTAEDVARRLTIMTDAVNRAYDVSDKDKSTLKIFLAPEFFFRGKDGAYLFTDEEREESIGECSDICHILKGLENIVTHKRFEDWLFLFGTVIASEKLPVVDTYDYKFYNFAPLYKGFDPATSKGVGKNFIVPKQYVSNLDFLTPLRHLKNTSVVVELLDGQDPFMAHTLMNPHQQGQKKYNNEMWTKYKDELNFLGYTMIEYGWFYMDGISLSVEICLDHLVHRALMTYMADVVTGSKTRIPSSANDSIEWLGIPRQQAQISLVSSSGMDVVVPSLALANGGHIFLQDGMDGDVPPHTTFGQDECQPNEVEFFGGSQSVKRTSVVSPTDVTFKYEMNLSFKDYDVYPDGGSRYWKDMLEGVFTTVLFPPKVTVYDPVDIASLEHGH